MKDYLKLTLEREYGITSISGSSNGFSPHTALSLTKIRFEVAFITAYHQQSDDTKLGKYERPGDPHICMRERLSE